MVITTINGITGAIRRFFEVLPDWHFTIVADQKTPTLEGIQFEKRCTFLSLSKQEKAGFFLHEKIPYNHYCRKNLGYLYAIIPAGLGATIMLVVALLINNIPKSRRYPEFWI